MKKILFDLSVCQPIGHIKHHGGGVYGYIIFKKICEINPQIVIAYIDKSKYLDPVIDLLLQKEKVETIDANVYPLKDIVNNNKIGLFYSPLYSSEYKDFYDSNIPIYITVHGLRKLEMNRDYYEYLYECSIKGKLKALIKQTPIYTLLYNKYYKEYLDLFVYNNINVITVSNHSKSSICFHYPTIKNEKINVYYSPSTTIEDYKKVISYSDEKYYLIISADRWLKNAYRALKAIDLLFEKNPQINGKVIIVGIPHNKRVIRTIKHKERVIVKDYVDKKILESLLKGAYALIYPSLNEGFGYPPLEAMKYGTPVISSPFSSIPEICADSVLYANPYSPEEIAMRILQLENEELYNEYKVKSINRYEYIVRKQKKDLDLMVYQLLAHTNED